MKTNRTFAEDASAPSLAEHDRRFHPNGFDPSRDRCSLREKLAKADEADKVETWRKPLWNHMFPIVNAAPAPFNSVDSAVAWAKDNGVVGLMKSEETNGKGDVNISVGSVREMMNPSQRGKSVSPEAHYAALTKLRDIIRDSELADRHPDYLKGEDGTRDPKNGINPEVTIDVLYGAMRFGDETYRVKTTLKRYLDRNFNTKAYAYDVSEIEVLTGNLVEPGSTEHNPNASTSLSGAILLRGIRDSKGNLLQGVRGRSAKDSASADEGQSEPFPASPSFEWPALPGLEAEDGGIGSEEFRKEKEGDGDDGDGDGYAEDALKLGAKPAVANTPVVQSLMDHDARFHPNGYKDGTKCKYREDRGIIGVGYDPSKAPSAGGSASGGARSPTSPAPTAPAAPAAAEQAGRQAVESAIESIRRDFPDNPQAEEAIAAIKAGLEVDLALEDLGLSRAAEAPAEAPAPETPAPSEAGSAPEAPASAPSSEEESSSPPISTEEQGKAENYNPPNGTQERELFDGLRDGLDAAGLEDVGITGSIDSPGFINFKLDLPLDVSPKSLRKAFEAINRATGFAGEEGEGPSVELTWDGGTPILTFPKKDKEDVTLAEALDSDEYAKAVKDNPNGIVVPFCRDNLGRLRCVDILKGPHMMVTGTTGSGKSAFLNSLITSICSKYGGRARIGIIDGKGNEFAPFGKLADKYLAHETLHSGAGEDFNRKTMNLVSNLVGEMDKRADTMKAAAEYLEANGFPGAAIEGIKAYNNLPPDQRAALDAVRDRDGNKVFPSRMEPIVEIIDEFGSIRKKLGKDSGKFDENVALLLAKARAAGISLIIANQGAYVKEIPADFQQNIPLQVTFKTKKNLPNTVPGKDLSGAGDMRFQHGDTTVRGQNCFIEPGAIRSRIPGAFKKAAPASSAPTGSAPTSPAPAGSGAVPSAPAAPSPTSPAPTSPSGAAPSAPASPAPAPSSTTASIQQAKAALQHLAAGNPVIATVIALLDQADSAPVGGLGSYAPPRPSATSPAAPAPTNRAPTPSSASVPAASRYPRTADGRIDISNLGFWKRIGAAIRLGAAGIGNKDIKYAPDPGEVRQKMQALSLPPDVDNHSLAKKYGPIPDTVTGFDRDMLAAAIKAYDRAVAAGRPEQARRAAAEYEMLVGGGKRQDDDAPAPLYV